MLQYCCPTCGYRDVLENNVASSVNCLKCGRRLDVSDPRNVFGSRDHSADDEQKSTEEPADRRGEPDGNRLDEPRPAPKRKRKRFCFACGESMPWRERYCPECEAEQPSFRRLDDDEEYRQDLRDASDKKLAAGLCAIFFGTLGVHKFVLGYTLPGVIYLLIAVCTCGFGAIVTWVIALIEGVIYLSKSDREFYKTYIVEKRQWF